MLIKRLEVKGFKSLKDVAWEPGALTILIGPNGSGKTNLLKALELIAFSAEGTLEEFIQDNGGIYSIHWDGREDTILLDTTLNLTTEQNPTEKILYSFLIEQFNNFMDYAIINENFLFFRSTKKNNSEILIKKEGSIRVNH